MIGASYLGGGGRKIKKLQGSSRKCCKKKKKKKNLNLKIALCVKNAMCVLQFLHSVYIVNTNTGGGLILQLGTSPLSFNPPSLMPH